MGRTFVIGDIHGCHDALLELFYKVAPDLSSDRIVFLGDYIDRGPDSKKVVSFILRLQEQAPGKIIPLMGNHEQVFLASLAGEKRNFYLKMGGGETLQSYGIKPPFSGHIASSIPISHIHFFHDLLLLWEDENYIYVHAGLEPYVHLSQQSPRWCCWAREQFLRTDYDFGKTVVFGHTPFDQPLVTKNRIGIDTGAVYGGKLTCLILPDMEFVSV
ncbi:MAG: serine/threonine protein phosphatase [Desulfobulbaceae bacterium]|nr:serine/threonine protein phosphatase [Desulfobulbaceae bacterium]